MNKYTIINTALTTRALEIAIPAPAIPIRGIPSDGTPKINKKLKTRLTTLRTAVVYRGVLLSPMPRRLAPITFAMAVAGIPIIQ